MIVLEPLTDEELAQVFAVSVEVTQKSIAEGRKNAYKARQDEGFAIRVKRTHMGYAASFAIAKLLGVRWHEGLDYERRHEFGDAGLWDVRMRPKHDRDNDLFFRKNDKRPMILVRPFEETWDYDRLGEWWRPPMLAAFGWEHPWKWRKPQYEFRFQKEMYHITDNLIVPINHIDDLIHAQPDRWEQ